MRKALKQNRLLIEKLIQYVAIGAAGYFYAWAVGLWAMIDLFIIGFVACAL